MSHDSNDLNKIREAAEQAIHPICQITDQTNAEDNFWFNAKRTDAGRSLPDYQLVYFLLIDLLKFKHSGQGEKIAWSVPIDYKGQAFLIEHRKFGVGVFTTVGKDKEVLAASVDPLLGYVSHRGRRGHGRASCALRARWWCTRRLSLWDDRCGVNRSRRGGSLLVLLGD